MELRSTPSPVFLFWPSRHRAYHPVWRWLVCMSPQGHNHSLPYSPCTPDRLRHIRSILCRRSEGPGASAWVYLRIAMISSLWSNIFTEHKARIEPHSVCSLYTERDVCIYESGETLLRSTSAHNSLTLCTCFPFDIMKQRIMLAMASMNSKFWRWCRGD